VLRAAAELRRRKVAVEYTLNAEKRATQKLTQQLKTASAVGAHKAMIIRSASEAEIRCLKHGGTITVELPSFLEGTARDPQSMRPVPDDTDPMTRCGSSEESLTKIP
jgi:hypothetical protein